MDQATSDKINNLRREVDPQWALERRKEFFQDLMADLVVDWWYERTLLSDYMARDRMMEAILTQVEMQQIVKKIIKLMNELYYRRLSMSGQQVGVTDDEIRRAREYPFEELLPMVKRGSYYCPFHEDHHPSASVKDNKLHCFVCNKTWSTIDFWMEKNGRTFTEAVRSLQ